MKSLVSVLITAFIFSSAIMIGNTFAEVAKVSDNIGGIYEIEEFKVGIKVFTDRDHIFKKIPDKYVGATYVRCPVKSVRETPKVDIVIEIDSPSQVYILWYTEDKWEGAKPAPPTDWLKKDYEKTVDEVVWGPAGTDIKFNPWESKTAFRPGEFHTYTTGNDCAYGMFVEEVSAVELSDKIATIWSNIKRIY